MLHLAPWILMLASTHIYVFLRFWSFSSQLFLIPSDCQFVFLRSPQFSFAMWCDFRIISNGNGTMQRESSDDSLKTLMKFKWAVEWLMKVSRRRLMLCGNLMNNVWERFAFWALGSARGSRIAVLIHTRRLATSSTHIFSFSRADLVWLRTAKQLYIWRR